MVLLMKLLMGLFLVMLFLRLLIEIIHLLPPILQPGDKAWPDGYAPLTNAGNNYAYSIDVGSNDASLNDPPGSWCCYKRSRSFFCSFNCLWKLSWFNWCLWE